MATSDPTSLENLHDIVESDPVSIWWPLAPGWWALIAIVSLATTIGIWRGIRNYQRNAYRRVALAEIDTPGGDLQRLPALLKRVALSAYPRSEVASLAGQDWIDFLNQEAPGCFDDSAATYLLSLAYVEKSDENRNTGLTTACKCWIKQHKARKELTV
ncbi:MAG: hypothetical protein ACI9E1_000183 [Cryomorphaceae bacterium]|jgi:hypothetical protein